jgi:hypothetical protein
MKPRLRAGPFQQKSVVLIVGIGGVKCVNLRCRTWMDSALVGGSLLAKEKYQSP